MANLAFDMCGSKPHSFPGVNMVTTDALFNVALGSFPHPECFWVSASSILLASRLVSCICPLYIHFSVLTIANSVKKVECSSNYQTLKGTGLTALNLVFPCLSLQQHRPPAFSVVPSSLSCFLYSFLVPVRQRPLGKRAFPRCTSSTW